MSVHRGGCSCGAVRFELIGSPLWTNLCHCNACKKRTGSAYGFSFVAGPNQIAAFTGATTKFLRRGESGKMCTYEFCPRCGTTVRWKVDLIDRYVFAGGALDDPRSVEVVAEMYTGQALPWARIGCALEVSGAPTDPFRMAAMEKSKGMQGRFEGK